MSRFVVVTTDVNRRGVFAGVLESGDVASGNVVLNQAQMAVYWSAETRGVVGLAANGPARGSRITPPVPTMELNGVTAILEATDAAQAAWRAQPWG